MKANIVTRDSLSSNHMPHQRPKCPYDCPSAPSAATFCIDAFQQPAGSISVKYPCSQSSLLWDFEDLRSSGLWRPWRPSASNRVELEQDLTHYRYHCNVPRLPTLT